MTGGSVSLPLAPRELAPRVRAALVAPHAGRAALVPYITGGHPDVATSHRLIDALTTAGADIVEVGVPFSDPIADGPVVQRSTHDALLAGVTPDDVFDLAATHRLQAPLVLLTYLNTIVAGGADSFFARAAEAGIEALVVPDLPLDEASAAWLAAQIRTDDQDKTPPSARSVGSASVRREASLAVRAGERGLALVPMATPTSSDERLDLIAEAAPAFVYCVAVTGVTGARRELGTELRSLIERLRARTDAPLVAGFGISTPAQASAAAELADGVIVGSALIARVSRAGGPDEAVGVAGDFVRSISAAIAAR
jgi:tryptophan synthase alpha chain